MNAFAAGTIPLVDGPKDYTAFSPTQKSVIRIDDFASPAALAAYLHGLAANNTAYEEYFEHKRRGKEILSEPFRRLWLRDRQKEAWSYSCLCRRAQGDLRAQDEQVRAQHAAPDRSCQAAGKWRHLGTGG